MDQPPLVLILAGGFATRLWPLTEKRAKPLLPLAGKELISHIIDQLPPEYELIISTNQRFQDAFDQLSTRYSDRKITLYIEDSRSDRQKKGALAATAQVIQEFQVKSPLLLIAGDNYFAFSIRDFVDAYDGKTLLASYDTKSLTQAKQFGVLGIKGKKLISFVEKPEDPPSTLISTGCYLFAPDHLPEIERYAEYSADNLGGIFEHLLTQQADIEVFPFEEQWIDIGSFESYLAAHSSLLSENLIHPSSQVLRTDLGQAVEIGPDCIIEDSELERVIILEGCRIKNARLRGCIIDKHCEITDVDLDRKMIREGSVLHGKTV